MIDKVLCPYCWSEMKSEECGEAFPLFLPAYSGVKKR